MNSTRGPARIKLVAVCLIAVGLAALAISGGQWLWQSRSSQAEPPQTAQSSGEAIAGFPSVGHGNAPPNGRAGEGREESRFVRARERMVQRHLGGRDVDDPKVLEVMGRVPRQRFVPAGIKSRAYDDNPLPIGHDQTISQPYIVALMTQLAKPKPKSRALDIGTGSGYQAAVLAEICKEVYSIEIVKPLAEEARRRLKELGYKNITVRHGDGYRGWPEKAPFDVIIVAAAPDHVPQPLVDQLAPGGKMVIPVGQYYQQLIVIERDKDGKVHRNPNIAVMFVPMTGEAQERRR